MKHVRYTRRFDYRPRASVVMARAAGDEVKVTEAEYEAANAAGAVELINGESAEQGEAHAEVGSTPAKGKAGNRARD
ncbi:hypothetical protein [Microvirga sp. P5_D2]